jgi:hypothetical protein
MSSSAQNEKHLIEKWGEVDTCVGDTENIV